jgi:hypothetical protein
MVPIRRHPAMCADPPAVMMMTMMFAVTVIRVGVLPDPPRLAIDMPAVTPVMPVVPRAAVVAHVVGAMVVMAPVTMCFSAAGGQGRSACPRGTSDGQNGHNLFEHPIPLATMTELYIGCERTTNGKSSVA